MSRPNSAQSSPASRFLMRRNAFSIPSNLAIHQFDDNVPQTINATGASSSSVQSSPTMMMALRRASSLPPNRLSLLTQTIDDMPAIEIPLDSPTEDDAVSEANDFELENPFSVFDDALFEGATRMFQRRRTEISYTEEVHICFSDDDDPLIGLLTEDASKSECCAFRSFLRMSDDNEAKSLTPFGRRLVQIGRFHDENLRQTVTDYWFWNWAMGLASLRDFLQRGVDYLDDEGVRWSFGSCSVCCAECRFVKSSPCCQRSICQLCWQSYVTTTATEAAITVNMTGMYDLHCFGCEKFVPYSEALDCLSQDQISLIRPPGLASCSVARCPVCLKVPPPLLFNSKTTQTKFVKKLRQKRGGRPVLCDRCHGTFCGICGLADHPTLSCDQLVASDEGFRKWSRQKNNVRPEFPNSRHCPSCKIPVAHNGGCPHMTCPCGAEFCFSCGRKYLKGLSSLTGHTSNRLLPLVSCPKMWDSQSKRIAVHSLVGFGLIAGVVPIAIALSPIVLTVGATVVVVQKVKQRRRLNRLFH